MSEPTPPTPPGAPVPGWYEDAHGLLRWWDGSGWTEHVQMPGASPPVATPPMPPSPQTSGDGSKYAAMIGVLVVSLLLLVGAVVLLSTAGGDDDGSTPTTDVVPGDDVAAQSAARSAQTAMETLAVDNNGSYSGITAEDLVALEGTLADAALEATGQETGYVITVISGEVAYTITRSGEGSIAMTCTPPGVQSCGESGTWG